MKNISTFIRGAIGIKKGLGLDEIEIDFTDKTGLVAFSGPNGTGKTTVLELMSLYRTMASRKGALKHHFFLRDSRMEHIFIYDGDRYHIIWKIDSGSDKSESFIKVNDVSMVNGKNKEYDKFINEKFGSQELFYNSVFCAQGSGNLSTMTTGKIKELFVEFLQIGRLAEYEKQCKIGVAYFQKKIDKLSGKIEACHFDLISFQNIDEEIKDSNIIISNNSLLLADTEKEITQQDTAINDLNTKAEKQKSDIARKVELEAELKELESDRDDIKKTITDCSIEYAKKLEKFENEKVSIDTILKDKEKILNASSRIGNLEKWEKYFSGCFECSIEEQARFDRDIKDIDLRKQAMLNDITFLENDAVLDGLKTTLKYLEKIRFNLDSNHSALQNKLKSAQNDFSLMQASQNVAACKEKIALSIDPDCKSKICPALEMVAQAKEELPGLEKIESGMKFMVDESIEEIETSILIVEAGLIDLDSRIGDCSNDLRVYSIDIKSKTELLNKNIPSLDAEKTHLLSCYLAIDEFKSFYKSKLTDTRALISDLKDLSSKKSQIEVAEANMISIKKQIKQFEDDYAAREIERDTSFENISSDIVLKEESIFKITNNIDLGLDKKICDSAKIRADAVIKKAEIVKKLDQLKESAAILKNNKSRKEKINLDLVSKLTSESDFKKELREWEYLRLACSKTGLQALEIDGAAPLITAEANNLLEKAFGLDSQIKIITQDPESGKEVFWIKVIREDGAEDDFSNLSGGQKVWISKALSLGMTLVSKHKSGRNFDSLYADEEDGALDGEKALEFVQLYRSMMLTGDFETCFFISHNPDVVAMADHVIDFGALQDDNAITMAENDIQRIN